MDDWDNVSSVYDMLEAAEVVQEFNDNVWISVDRELWEAFCEEAVTV